MLKGSVDEVGHRNLVIYVISFSFWIYFDYLNNFGFGILKETQCGVK